MTTPNSDELGPVVSTIHPRNVQEFFMCTGRYKVTLLTAAHKEWQWWKKVRAWKPWPGWAYILESIANRCTD